MSPQAVIDHVPALRRYARALTGDVWAADDLLQDTLERACSKWVLWRGGDLRAWLFTLMHNLYLNQRRPSAQLAQVPLGDAADELAAPPGARDASIDLQRCLMRLPADQRAVLLLVTLEDVAYADAARILGVPLGTVMSRLSRARARLRELMEAPAQARADTASVVPSGSTPLRRLK